MTRIFSGVLLLLSLGACRTILDPAKAEVDKPIEPRVRTECDVRDYPHASEVPDGAKNIGFVQVPIADTDEQTYINLRKAICEKGGDALSQMAWVREVGERTPSSLRANAWVLP
jgi:hypothetical protein